MNGFKLLSFSLIPKLSSQILEVVDAFKVWCQARGYSTPKIQWTRVFNASREALGAAEHVARVLYCASSLENDNNAVALKLKELVTTGKIGEANKYLEKETGYSIAQNPQIYFPQLIERENPLGFLSFPTLLFERFREARSTKQIDSFFKELSSVDVWYMAMAERVTAFKPSETSLESGLQLLSYTNFCSKVMKCDSDEDHWRRYSQFVDTQFTTLQVRRFLELNKIPQSDEMEKKAIQSREFLTSPFGDTKSIGYLRSFIQFLEQKIGLTPQEITKILKDPELQKSLYPVDEKYSQYTGFQAVADAFIARELGHRVESKTRGIDKRDMGGLGPTYRKMEMMPKDGVKEPDVASPLVMLDPKVPCLTYSTRFNSSGIFWHVGEGDFVLGGKTDWGSDRVAELSRNTEYHSTQPLELRLDYLEAKLSLKGKMFRTREAQIQKFDEIEYRQKNPEQDRSSKAYLADFLSRHGDIPKNLDDGEIDTLLKQVSSEKGQIDSMHSSAQIRLALQKIKALPQKDREIYLKKTQQIVISTARGTLGKYSSQKVIRHNESWIMLRKPEQALAVSPTLDPSGITQARELQDSLYKINGGYTLPYVIYAPEEKCVVELSTQSLNDIETSLAGLNTSKDPYVDIEASVKKLTSEYPNLVSVTMELKKSLLRYLLLRRLSVDQDATFLEQLESNPKEYLEYGHHVVGKVFESWILNKKNIQFIAASKSIVSWAIRDMGKPGNDQDYFGLKVVEAVASYPETVFKIIEETTGIKWFLVKLTDLMEAQCTERQKIAISALGLLCRSNNMRLEMLSTDVYLAKLIKLLEHESHPIRRIADASLRWVASWKAQGLDTDKPTMDEKTSQYIASIVKLLDNDKPRIRRFAAGSLLNVSQFNPDEAKTVMGAAEGCIEKLVKLLEDEPAAYAVQILMYLSYLPEITPKIAKVDNCIANLVKIFNQESQELKSYALCTLMNLSALDSCKAEIFRIYRDINLFVNENPEYRSHQAFILENIRLNEDNNNDEKHT
jgi:hypothetical protein